MTSTAKQAKRQRQREARRKRSPSDGALVYGSRVLLKRPVEPKPTPADQKDAIDGICTWLETGDRERAKVIHPIVRLTDEGPDWGAPPLVGEEVGYAMHPYRNDECFRAAVATVTQTSIEEVPDFHLDKRLEQGEDVAVINSSSWDRFDAWVASRSLVMQVWAQTPAPRERWIAVSEGTADNSDYGVEEFIDHCLVMSRDRVLFDPSCSLALPPGMEIRKHDLSSVSYGLSFDDEEE